MACKLSKSHIHSYRGDVLPLYLCSEEDLTHAEITWKVEGDCVTARSFQGDSLYHFNYGVLLTLVKVGESTVTALYQGKEYSCTVSVRAMETASSEDELNYYFGDFHCHTSKDHNHQTFAEALSTIPDYVAHMKKEDRLHASVISDHADVTNPRDFFRGFTEAEAAQPMHCVLFPGSESEITPIEEDRLGLSHKNAGEIVCLNTDNFTSTDNWEDFAKAMETTPFGVCIFAHPQVVGYDKNGVWNFCFHKNNTPQMKHLFRGIEMGDGTIRSSNCIHELSYSAALDSGFRVSVTSSSDCHGPNWGFDRIRSKTIVMAKEHSKEAFLDALRNNRFYPTESGNLKLRYRVNGHTAPADLPLADTYHFCIEWSLFRDEPASAPAKLQVISDFGEILFEQKNPAPVTEFTLPSSTARYFYLRLQDQEGYRTLSCPVWTGRPFQDMTPPAYPPLDKAAFTARDLVTGADVSVLLNNDPREYWESTAETAEIIIDMGASQKIRALGHYPPMIPRKTMTELGLKEEALVSSFACRYRLSASADGKAFTPLKNGIFRIFGGEEIASFPDTTARFLKLEVLSTTGNESGRKEYAGFPLRIGELTVF